MTTRAKKPSAPDESARDRDEDDQLGVVLAALEAIRGEIASLRDEVRALAQRPSAQRRNDRRTRKEHDPGDAVPEGVAVETPAPLTPQDRKAKRGLERLSRQE